MIVVEEGNKRNISLQVLVTRTERDQIEQLVKEEFTTVSSFVRRRLIPSVLAEMKARQAQAQAQAKAQAQVQVSPAQARAS